jgi:NhaP-type Na+/H+ or K+/H+ antiporter
MLSENEIIIGLSTIIVFGLGAQWLGRRTGIPSLLLLLPAGLLAGDVFDLVEPDKLFGDTLNPLVTLLVALLLFQSGIGLRVADLPPEARGSVARLVSIGLALTFAGATAAAALFLDVPAELAFMIGAILVVSGPTVVGPLLDVVRPRQPTGKVLLWEGTALDPIGAILGVVVLNVVLASDRGGVHPVLQMLGRLGLGITVGVIAAALLVFVMSRFLLTDDMEAAVGLLFATAAFAVADVLLSEAGLFATVTLGFVVANQRVVSTRRISGFGETLEVLIIGTLFILLGALVKIDDLVDYAAEIALIVAALVLVVRPLVAAVSLWRTPLTGRDRALVGWMDPRGIVAAATATQFTGTLNDANFDAGFLLPVTFGVILGTGVIYGLTAKPVAGLLGVAQPPPTGVGLVGDDAWLVSFGRHLAEAGVETLLVTTEPSAADQPAQHEGEAALTTTSLREGVGDVKKAVDAASLAKVVVSVDPDAALTLLESHLLEDLGRRHILRVPRKRVSAAVPEFWTAHAFGGKVTRVDISDRYQAGATVQVVTAPVPPGALLLAAVSPDADVDLEATPEGADPDDTLIALVDAVI